MRWTWFLLPSLLFLSATAVACGDDDDADNGGVVLGTTPESQNPDTLPGDDQLGGDVEDVVRQHLETEFGDRPWVGDVGDIEQEDEKLTVQMRSDFDQDDFDEACTAIVASAMDGPFGVEEVVMRDKDGDEVMRSRPGEPQCEPVSR